MNQLKSHLFIKSFWVNNPFVCNKNKGRKSLPIFVGRGPWMFPSSPSHHQNSWRFPWVYSWLIVSQSLFITNKKVWSRGSFTIEFHISSGGVQKEPLAGFQKFRFDLPNLHFRIHSKSRILWFLFISWGSHLKDGMVINLQPFQVVQIFRLTQHHFTFFPSHRSWDGHQNWIHKVSVGNENNH